MKAMTADDRIKELETELNRLECYVLLTMLSLVIVLGLGASTTRPASNGILRARGLVIVDDAGRGIWLSNT
jgi:hypothetical protein